MDQTLTAEAFEERFRSIADKIEALKAIEHQLLEQKQEEYKLELEKVKLKCQSEVDALKSKLNKLEQKNGTYQVSLPKEDAKSGGDCIVPAPQKAAAAQKAPAAGKPQQQKQQPKKGKSDGKKKEAAPAPSDDKVDISRIELRVGQIREVKLHPNAESLYVEQMDVGEAELRNVVTGVVKFVPIEQMQNRKVIVMCNLKPSKIRGLVSQAMVMCASTPEKVEIIDPPADSKPGDVVFVPGFAGTADKQLNPKKKVLERILPDLHTDSSGRACYKGVPFQVEGVTGECKSQSLKNVKVK